MSRLPDDYAHPEHVPLPVPLYTCHEDDFTGLSAFLNASGLPELATSLRRLR